MTANPPRRADTVVVGGGIMGASIAWQLARRNLGTVILIERDVIAAGASGRTGALLRQHYTNIPEATLASRSLNVFRNWNELVGGDCGFVESGVVVTVSTLNEYADNVPRMQRVIEQLRSLGVTIDIVDAAQLTRIDPAAQFDDIGVATFERESGFVDAIAATRSMTYAAVRAGVTVLEGAAATRILATSSRVTGVETTAGPIEAERVMLACGPWTPSLASTVGVELPISAQRVQVAVFQTPATLPSSVRCYVDNVAATFCRPWGPGRTMVGLGGGEIHDPVDPDDYEWRTDQDFPEMARSAMERRFPAFAQARFLHGHAGLYDMSPDGHPIIGPAGPDGLWIVAGFSGAGFKKGPAVGMAVAGSLAGNVADRLLLDHFQLDRDWGAPWSAFEYRLAHDFGHGF